MHGVICFGLHDWVGWRFGEAVAEKIRSLNPAFRAECPETFPDADFFSVLPALSQITGRSRSSLLEDFGRYMARPLIYEHKASLPDHWTALEVIEYTEPCIDRVIDTQQRRSSSIRCWRTPDDAVRVMYNSSRRICEFPIGLFRGIGDYFGEDLVIDQTRCMNRGDAYCELFIRSKTLKLSEDPANVQMLRIHPSVVEEAVDIVTRKLNKALVDEHTTHDIVVSAMEAIGNVVRHAKSSECELAVHVQDGTVNLQVTDYGPGFALTKREMPDPFAESGRGIAMMQSVCDSVDYEMRAAGNCLTLLKRGALRSQPSRDLTARKRCRHAAGNR